MKSRVSDFARKGFPKAQLSKSSGHITGDEQVLLCYHLASEDKQNQQNGSWQDSFVFESTQALKQTYENNFVRVLKDVEEK